MPVIAIESDVSGATTRRERQDFGAPSRGRRLRSLLLLTALVIVLAVAGGLALMLPARGSLVDARSAMLVGRDAVARGELTTAGDAFGQAEGLFRDALGTLGNPLTRLASWTPLLGRTPDAVRAAAEAGVLVARAGREVTDAATNLPGGVGALAPRDGRIPLEPLQAVAEPLDRARRLTLRAEVSLRAAPRSLVPALVTEPLETFTIEAGEARRAIASAAAAVRALPRFLGSDGTKRYFLGAQNPAELRGTGGLVGAFAILSANDGRIEVGAFRDVLGLRVDDDVALDPPNQDYERLYGQNYRDMSNINMTPDFPTAATAIERLYRTATGEPVDGTILADPHALALLLGAAGPAEVPAIGTTIDAESVVDFVANEAYALLPDAAARKRIVGDVAAGVLAHFLGTGAADDPAAAGRAVIEAATGGHLLLHSADPALQRQLRVAGISGALGTPAGDFFAVVGNNAGGNKIDFFARRTLRYEATLLEDGFAQGRLSVTIENDAPAAGQPRYVIGPHPFVDARPGESISNVQAYCALSCRFQEVRLDGVQLSVSRQTELDHPMVVTGVGIPPGGTGHLDYAWITADAWTEERGLVVYRLTVLGQPTIVPTRLELSVAIPENAEVARITRGMRVDGDRVVWSGAQGNLDRFEVAFRRPFPAGLIGSI